MSKQWGTWRTRRRRRTRPVGGFLGTAGWWAISFITGRRVFNLFSTRKHLTAQHLRPAVSKSVCARICVCVSAHLPLPGKKNTNPARAAQVAMPQVRQSQQAAAQWYIAQNTHADTCARPHYYDAAHPLDSPRLPRQLLLTFQTVVASKTQPDRRTPTQEMNYVLWILTGRKIVDATNQVIYN